MADLPLASVGMPIHKASTRTGLRISAACGGDGYNLAERWENVTCEQCKVEGGMVAALWGLVVEWEDGVFPVTREHGARLRVLLEQREAR